MPLCHYGGLFYKSTDLAFLKTFLILYLTQVYSRYSCVFLSNFELVQNLKITFLSVSFFIVKRFLERIHQYNNLCLIEK